MAILLKTTSVRVSSIQIMQVRVQNKGKSVWKSRYDGDVSILWRRIILRHLASMLWMFDYVINIHNLHPIHSRSMILLFIISINYCSLMNNLLVTFMQWARVYKTLK